jgi:hypothetical protein
MRASASTFAALAFAVGACASDTGIVIEVSWTEADFPAAETLRIYVATGDPTRAAVDEASVAEPVEMITLPYRYLLRPDGALGDIGPLVLAAGLTAGEPPQPLAFDVYPEAVAFADGEIRTVRLTPTSRTYESHGPNAACAIYADDLGQPRTIGLPGDADCDGTLDGSDCAPLEPTDDVDGDGVTCDVDCLDSGGSVRYSPGGLEVLIKPESVFPGQNVRDFRMLNAVPPHIECLHVDFDCSGQCRDEAKLPGGPPVVVETDASGADDCGSIFAAEDPPLCPIAPSDCDPDQPENQSTTESESEICDGRDTDCDGFLATPDPVHSARGRGLPGGRARLRRRQRPLRRRLRDRGEGDRAGSAVRAGSVPAELPPRRGPPRLRGRSDLGRRSGARVSGVGQLRRPTRGDRGAAGPGHRYVHLDRGRRERARRLDRRVRQARLVLH